MFCPKCGIENPDDGKFCRSCGTNLSSVLAALDEHLPEQNNFAIDDNATELFSTGIRNIILGFGFLAVSVFLFAMPGDTIFWLMAMIPGFVLLASGISRTIKADAIKKQPAKSKDQFQQTAFPAVQSKKELPPSQTDYVKPARSIYKTDDLLREPASITEPTTQHLELNAESETMTLPKK